MHLCEAENVSYLDEVASNAASQDMAKSVGLEVLISGIKVSFSFAVITLRDIHVSYVQSTKAFFQESLKPDVINT